MDRAGTVCIACIKGEPRPAPQHALPTQNATHPTPTAPVQPTRIGILHQPIGAPLGGLTSIILAILWFGYANGWFASATPPGSAGVYGTNSSTYQIQVTTRPAIKFTGGYMVVAGDGTSTSRSVEGVGVGSYSTGHASMVSVSFQKAEPTGSLTVEIWRDGQQVQTQSTEAEFGVVSVATR